MEVGELNAQLKSACTRKVPVRSSSLLRCGPSVRRHTSVAQAKVTVSILHQAATECTLCASTTTVTKNIQDRNDPPRLFSNGCREVYIFAAKLG